MNKGRSLAETFRADGLRLAMLVLGGVLILLSPLVGIVPGPGGIFVFAAGLVLILRNSMWARRRYARLKRRWPRWGAIADRGMRRRSALRRKALSEAAAPDRD